MRVSKVFSFIFGILGTALLLLTVYLSLTSLKGETVVQVPVEAVDCSKQLMEALKEGDYLEAEKLLYGDSRLGDPREASSDLGKKVWMAFSDSFTYEFTSDCYGSGNGLSRDVIITTMDITSISDSLQQRAKEELEIKEADAKEAENMGLVYQDGVVLDSVMDEILATAVAGALAEDVRTHTTKLTLELVNEGGTWQVVPSAELLKAVAGGL